MMEWIKSVGYFAGDVQNSTDYGNKSMKYCAIFTCNKPIQDDLALKIAKARAEHFKGTDIFSKVREHKLKISSNSIENQENRVFWGNSSKLTLCIEHSELLYPSFLERSSK